MLGGRRGTGREGRVGCRWWRRGGGGISRQRADTIKTRKNELLNTSIKKYKTWPRFYAAWAALQAGDKVVRVVGWRVCVCVCFPEGGVKTKPTSNPWNHSDALVNTHTINMAASFYSLQINGGTIRKRAEMNHWRLHSSFPFEAFAQEIIQTSISPSLFFHTYTLISPAPPPPLLPAGTHF